jgi:FKBP-type peptidyl-prolyl cis-trans isomerase 2
MKEGELKNIRAPPNKAYGTKIENSIISVPKLTINNYENLRINDVVIVVTPDGNRISTYVKKIGEENITVDMNHPLAGEYVQFAIMLGSIE